MHNHCLAPQNRVLVVLTLLTLSGCGAGQSRETPQVIPAIQPAPLIVTPGVADSATDEALRGLINQQNIQGFDAQEVALPDIQSPMAQLGKQLFFSKNLGGENSVACVSCHHPMLGGADALSLSVGVDSINQLNQQSHALLGQGRFSGTSETNMPLVPRNAPSVFNIALQDEVVFWDGRIERLGDGTIVTPDSVSDNQGARQADPNLPTGISLADAQSRFPLTSAAEMRGDFGQNLENQFLRGALAGRFDNSIDSYTSTWPQAFELAYGDQQVDIDRISHAIGEYERSMVFVNNNWETYLQGDNDALSEQQKLGAILFFTPNQQGGAGCNDCHSGTTFSDSGHHLVAFPHIGPGKGDDSGTGPTDDFGRERVTGDISDRYHFRTPTLLNVTTSAPYGHSGAYQTLHEVVRHYVNPQGEINDLFAAQGGSGFVQGPAGSARVCQLEQFAAIIQKNNLSCEAILGDGFDNSNAASQHLQQARNGQVRATAILANNARLNAQEVDQIVAFLTALTDPCVLDRSCMQPWIIDGNDEATYPDNAPLIAEDQNGAAL
jgi:cytochrome c peroxidase